MSHLHSPRITALLTLFKFVLRLSTMPLCTCPMLVCSPRLVSFRTESKMLLRVFRAQKECFCARSLVCNSMLLLCRLGPRCVYGVFSKIFGPQAPCRNQSQRVASLENPLKAIDVLVGEGNVGEPAVGVDDGMLWVVVVVGHGPSTTKRRDSRL